MADQYDPNAIHNRGKQRINGSLTVTGAAEFGEVPTVNGQKLKTAEIFTDVIHITDTTPIEKIYDVSKYALTYAEIKVNNGTNCYVKPVMTQKNASDDNFVDLPDKFSSYYTESTTSKLAVQNMFTKEKLKLAVSFEGDRVIRLRYDTSTVLAASYTNFLLHNLDAHEIKLKVKRWGNILVSNDDQYENVLYNYSQNPNSPEIKITGRISDTCTGVYGLYLTLLRYDHGMAYFNLRINDNFYDGQNYTSNVLYQNTDFAVNYASGGSYNLGNYVPALDGLSLIIPSFQTSDINASETIGTPNSIYTHAEFECTVDDSAPITYIPNGNTTHDKIYPFSGESFYIYIKSSVGTVPNEGEYIFNIDPATVDATITFKAF